MTSERRDLTETQWHALQITRRLGDAQIVSAATGVLGSRAYVNRVVADALIERGFGTAFGSPPRLRLTEKGLAHG